MLGCSRWDAGTLTSDPRVAPAVCDLRASAATDISNPRYPGSSDRAHLAQYRRGILGLDMADRVTTGRFVGRTNELAWLRELLVRAGDGEPLVVLLGGEAGVGKTRLVEQLAAAAEEQGTRVLVGGCVPLGEEGLLFAPVIEALRGLADQLDPAKLARVAGPARAELGRLLPDLAWAARRPRGPRSPAEPVRGGCSSCCWGWWSGWRRGRRCCGSWRTSTGPTAPPATCSLSWPPTSAPAPSWWC